MKEYKIAITIDRKINKEELRKILVDLLLNIENYIGGELNGILKTD